MAHEHEIVILAGAELSSYTRLKAYITAHTKKYSVIIAADAGLKHAAAFGLMPQVIVGDFDSVAQDLLASYSHITQEQHSPEKDYLDLELALSIAKERYSPLAHITLLGVLGGRLDQSLAALFIAARLKKEGLSLSLHSHEQDVYVLYNEKKSLFLAKGTVFSLLSVEQEALVSLKGAKYELENYSLAFGVGLGLSNEARQPIVEISVKGLLFVIVEYGLS